ncbi:LacI family DNA-binding transcriptional regulator [Lichenibacterium ramalinae]|uniref:LacI family DNA-binding transcriptional regulator n=1 Tax=Lichenibacterium ramalinae TaxID=2316527 RepID=UPI0013ED1755|nr:LacI family DNA-binding transcriptional regulator [Lichenibacterium ramalinae]
MASPRATLADVAREAGLSAATVDRVLNRRAPVRAETARRVRDAAEAVGFHAARLLANRVDAMRPERRLGFLLQRRGTEVYRDLAAELVRATTDPALGRHRPMVEHMEDLTPASVAERVARLGERCDALGIVAADHPRVSAAVDRLAASGKPVYTLLSDLGTEARAGYFGIDHRKAGRTAGWVMVRLAGGMGDVGIVVGSHRYLGHELCEISFRAYLREHAPGLKMLEPLASFEDPHFAQEAMLDLLKRKPDLTGLYVPGGGIEGIIAALRDSPPARHIVVVAMDLFTETREALLDGTIDIVIATPLAEVARTVVAAMLDRLDGKKPPPAGPHLRFELCLSENI